ncbi:MAG: H4MPT-linked C1 transfer pathway protein [Planctomycetaceae bacterium]|nr:H4MPT-linked C1 transfer pathway protein [Planctomycetaceae bacterium]
MSIVGLDIGGANLKAAHIDGECLSEPFPLWQHPEQLSAKLAELVSRLPTSKTLAVTMTGELADCYISKTEGVLAILDAVEEMVEGRSIHVWNTAGEFVDVEVAREFPILVAAANWHALATWVGKLTPEGNALLVDIGTTTTDVIPLEDGFPVPLGRTDLERLQTGELEYTGSRRTILCSLAHTVPVGRNRCLVSSELFATTHDIYLWLGDTHEDASDTSTADGRPATREATRDRLCRLICADRHEVTDDDLTNVCLFLKDVQKKRITGSIDRVRGRMVGDCDQVILSGSGSFLAEEIFSQHAKFSSATLQSLSSIVSPAAAESACAVALTRLAEERL